jgi:DNA-binding transcriptional LysR family regulator
MNNVSIRHFEQLIALERHRHFGRAADSLSMSQPALSRSILTLERNLGTPLFDRSSRGLEPTPNGRLLIRHGRRILAATAELQSEFDERQGAGQSRLSIACGHYPAELSIPGALSDLMKAMPRAQVNMEVTDWVRIAGLLASGACDLAVTELSAAGESTELVSELLNDRELHMVVRRGHPLMRLDSPELDDILAYPWVCSHIPARVARLFGASPVEAGDLDAANGNFIPKIIAASLSTAFKLVIENDLVGFAPTTLAWPYVQRGELFVVPFRASWLQLNYGFMWQARRPPSALARAFMDRVRAAESRVADQEQAIIASLGI